MCNLYRMRSGPGDILAATRAMVSQVGNLEPRDIYPDYPAPIVRTNAGGERELVLSRWGLPSSKKALFDAASKRADKLRAKGKDVDFPKILEMEPDSVGGKGLSQGPGHDWLSSLESHPHASRRHHFQALAGDRARPDPFIDAVTVASAPTGRSGLI